MALALGTSGAVRVLVEAEIPAIPPGLWVYRLDRRHSLLGGALSEGGNLYAWLQETLALAPAAEVEAELAGLPADGHGLTILPFLAGERSPGWHGDVRATVSGLSLHTRPVEILRAGLESIGYRFAILAALVRQVVPEATTIIGSGAPLRRSSAWAQIICDILGRSMSLAGDAELATSRGVTLLALHALGVIPHLDALPLAPEGIFTPDAAYHARYREGAERHRQLYGVLIGRT
jgi:gluconokinase